jgi:hypothetical protein
MAIYSSKTELKGSTAPTGLGPNYSTQGKLSTFIFPVNGNSVSTWVEVDSNGGQNNISLVGSNGTLAYYDKTSNKWSVPAGQGNSTISKIIIDKIKNTSGLANAMSQSAYYTTYHKTGNSAQATQITGVSPSTPAPTVTQPAQGLNGSAPQNQPGGGPFGNPLDNFVGVATALTSGDQLLKGLGGGLLKYPEDLLDSGQDTLVITQFRYNPPRGNIFTTKANVFQNGIKRNTALSEKIIKVVLPAPNNASDSNNVSWGPDNMNNLTAAAAGAVLTNMGGVATSGAVGAVLGTIVSALTSGNLSGLPKGGALGIKAAVYKALLDQASGSANAGSLINTALASQALNMAGFEVSPESILSSGAGVIPNSNLELLFNAPTLREFTFEYRLSPRSSNEARIVRNIIRSFKQGMAPRKVNAQGGTGPGGYFLATPNVFKLEYKTGNSSIEGVNKIKICALTGFSVNYTPDGQWAAYEGGQPVSYIIRMSYTELDPVYENDYYDQNSDADLESIGTNDIGY